MTGPDLAIGTRGSRLALIQAGLVADALRAAGTSSRIVVIESDGDRRAPDTAWGEGAFVVAIERALVAGDIDVAVHSAKDVPIESHADLTIGAYLPRADPRDALVVRVGTGRRGVNDLPPGARVGTDSPRRTAFLRAWRPDLDVHPLHGNVDTRLRRLDAGETDALVLACAGLDRLGSGDRIAQRLAPGQMPPAPGQGAIAVQIRADDDRLARLVARLDDPETRVAVEAERAILRACGGGCRSPIGVLVTIDGDVVTVIGGAARVDGSDVVMADRHGGRDDLDGLAVAMVADLRHARARRVIVTRAEDRSARLGAALRDLGVEAVSVPSISVELVPGGGDLDAAARGLAGYDWTVVTSVNGVRSLLAAAERVLTPLDGTSWAAVGGATAAALAHDGIATDFIPNHHDADTLARTLPVSAGQRVLVVRGDLAGDALARTLRDRGAIVDDVVGYRTCEGPIGSRPILEAAFASGPIDAVLLTSGSTVRGLLALAAGMTVDPTHLPAVCIGPETATVARAAGFTVIAVAATAEERALARATHDALVSAAAR